MAKKKIINTCDWWECNKKATHTHRYIDTERDDFEVTTFCDEHEEIAQDEGALL